MPSNKKNREQKLQLKKRYIKRQNIKIIYLKNDAIFLTDLLKKKIKIQVKMHMAIIHLIPIVDLI